MPVNGQPSQTEYVDAQINPEVQPQAVVPTQNEGAQVCNSKFECSLLLISWSDVYFLHYVWHTKNFIQVLESIDKRYIVDPRSQNNLQHLSSQFHEGLTLDSLKHNSESEVCNITL